MHTGNNQPFWSHLITNLKPSTVYTYFVKVEDNKYKFPHARRSNIKSFVTMPDYPAAPTVYTISKDSKSIQLGWFPTSNEIKHFIVDIFEHNEDQQLLDKRNYCLHPFHRDQIPAQLKDDANCCDAAEFDEDDYDFDLLIQKRFGCSANVHQFCEDVRYINGTFKNFASVPPGPILAHYVNTTEITLGRNVNMGEFIDLKPYTLYTFLFYACTEYACGTPSQYSERTAPDKNADEIITITISTSEIRKSDFIVTPLTQPNGAILAYYILYQGHDNIPGGITCLTRQDFEDEMNFQFKATHDNCTIGVRVLSLAGFGKVNTWVKKARIPLKQHSSYNPYPIFITIISLAVIIVLLYIYYMRRRKNTVQRPIVIISEGEQLLLERLVEQPPPPLLEDQPQLRVHGRLRQENLELRQRIPSPRRAKSQPPASLQIQQNRPRHDEMALIPQEQDEMDREEEHQL